jgi:hypothetical protein
LYFDFVFIRFVDLKTGGLGLLAHTFNPFLPLPIKAQNLIYNYHRKKKYFRHLKLCRCRPMCSINILQKTARLPGGWRGGTDLTTSQTGLSVATL